MSVSCTIRKVVIPAAGLGIRLLPATKVVPKEMMPIAARPLIQFAVEEAAASGLETVILVVGKGKNLVAEHFHRNLELEDALVQRGKSKDADLIRRLSELIEIRIVHQDVPLGLADAIRSARALPLALSIQRKWIASEYWMSYHFPTPWTGAHCAWLA